MADEWPTTDIITDDTESQIDCKQLKERTEEKFEGEENIEWQRRSVETSSEGGTFTTNESGSVLSDADRERSSASSVISEKLEDQTFEGEEVDENDEEAYWNEMLAAEAERALERAHIPHPNFFVDDSNRFGPNITILSSTSSRANEEIVIKAAAKAIEQFPTNKTLAARMIKKLCEEKLDGAWHCIVSDGDIGVFSRNEEHIHFSFRHNTVYMFRHQCYEPSEMRIRRLKNHDNAVMEIQIPDSVNVIANGMNFEKQQYAIRLAINTIVKYESENNNAVIAEKIVDGFEEIYGAHFHCAVSDKDIGCHIQYDSDNIVVFSFDGLTICLFKENSTNEDPFTSLHPLRERKLSGMIVPLMQPRRQYVIESGMDPEMLQLAISIAQTAISESKSVQKIAHTMRTEFESKHTGPYHCIVANGHFGFYGHCDENEYARFVVDDHYVFLFRSKDIPAKDLRVTRYIPIGFAAPDIRVVSSGMTRPKERFAIDLTSEGIQRYVGDKMRAAKHVVERFEERHGTPYHCAMSEGELGFSVHHKAAMHFKIGSTAVLLFRNL